MTVTGGEGGYLLTVLCVYKTGGVFGPVYVEKLRDSVSRNLSLPHRFVCLTDAEIEGIDCLPLEYGWPRHYAKAEMFRPDLPFGRVLYIDLSTVVKGNIDDFATQRGVVVTKDFYFGTPSQSVLLYGVGDFAETFEAFRENAEALMEIGDRHEPPDFYDQVLMNRCPVPPMRYWQDVLPGKLASFKLHGNPPEAAMVKFHGRPKPHDVNWLEDVEYSARLNCPESRMLENAAANWKRDLPHFDECPAHDRTANIVAGGPSLAETFVSLAFADGDVFALNGVHDFLLERGSPPDFMVLLDARPENVRFFSRPVAGVRYLIAAVCDPSVFDALEGFDVMVWANDHPGISECVPGASVLVGGGATVGLKTLCLAYLMGYRKFRLFGFDSCYRGESNHAYSQSLNDGEDVLSVWAGNREYRAAPWMAKQAREFGEWAKRLVDMGCEIEIVGDGLIADVAAQLSQGKMDAA